MTVKVVDLAREGKLLPPAPDRCQCCAAKHEPEQPHNWQSMFWQYWYYNKHGRWPTMRDAFEHVTPELRQAWVDSLRERAAEARLVGNAHAAGQFNDAAERIEALDG